MGPVHVVGEVTVLRKVTAEDLSAENRQRASKGWEPIRPHVLAAVYCIGKAGTDENLLRVEMRNGRTLERGEMVDLVCHVYARGRGVALVCFE